MIITYSIFLLLAIIFKMMQWPGAGPLFLIGPVFLFTDIIIQSVKKKEDQLGRILSSVGLFLLSLFISFKFLRWSNSSVILIVSMAILIIYFFQFFKLKSKLNTRFFIVVFLTAFAVFNVSLKNSTFKMLYMAENPFQPGNKISSVAKRSLAYDFYLEGDYEKAWELIQQNLQKINQLLEIDNIKSGYRDILEKDFSVLQRDSEQLIKASNNPGKYTWTPTGDFQGFDYEIELFRINIYE